MLLTTVATTATAQCPDGAPPPCKRAVPAVLRSANPALNPKGWIVVPFGNVMKAQELSQYRVIRGGAFDTNDSLAAAWMRGYLKASALPAELPNTGFRCASG